MNEKIIQQNGLTDGFRHMIAHITVTLIAIGIAFSLPELARYILYQWWPKVEGDTELLLITEIGFATVLVLLLNIAKAAWGNGDQVAAARLASLVSARGGNSWISQRRQGRLMKKLLPTRDVFAITLTGFSTFVGPTLFREALEGAYEIRVMLMHPFGEAIERRVDTLHEAVTLGSFRDEISATMEQLAAFQKTGKKVTLKFYDQNPFWKVIVLGGYLWVQYCHSGFEVKEEPEYVFALQHRNPRLGFFVPFYMHFLEFWNQSCHPQYDFETGELVYRDQMGNEKRRVPLASPLSAEDSEPWRERALAGQ